jgi:hypothetical protein
MTFIRTETGGGEASGSGYDDRVMAMMISLFTQHQVLDEEPLDSPDFQTSKSPLSFSPQAPKNYIDKEFAMILDYGKDDTYEQSWLNY